MAVNMPVSMYRSYQLTQWLQFSRLTRYILATYLATVHYTFQTNRQETTYDIDMLVLCIVLTNDRRSCVCVVCAQCQNLQ